MINFNISDKSAFMRADTFETLRLVMDPELHVNIVDLGLVYHVNISEPEKLIRVTMTLSSSYCPMGESIVNAVKNCLEKHYPPYRADVELVWEPVWSYDNITDEGKRQLGLEK
jgi:metal-sulfur cluster biosynthetic enzyme